MDQVGELIGHPVPYKRNLTQDDDVNNIEDGFYYYAGDIIPSNVPEAKNSMFLQISSKPLINMGYVHREDIWQFIFCMNTRDVYARAGFKDNILWTDWTIIFNAGILK